MFVDVAKVKVEAGKGGDGAVSFRREIYIPKGGPDGGDGGKGGSVVFRADKDTNTLLDFRYNPILKAEDGKNGSGTRSAGRSGEDLIVEVPIGTQVWLKKDAAEKAHVSPDREIKTKDTRDDAILLADLTHDKQEAVIAKGGDGGFGNAHFKSSVRQAPIIHELGEPGEAFEVELELKLLADVGLVGLPNAGKSTFLSIVTNAKPEIADYPFTTITPNLGVATVDEKDILIADIPGLIEGASEGKGLGNVFLRHVDRTAVLLHLVDVYNDDAGEAYKTIRAELDKYSDLKDRPEIVALTKCEGVDEDILKMQMQSILEVNPSAKVFAISSVARQGTEELLRALKSAVEENKMVESAVAPVSVESDSIITFDSAESFENSPVENRDIPVIKLNPKISRNAWKVEKTGENEFRVTGEKIEKFARRTDFNNYESLNRLRDILKKHGIRAELTSQGAKEDSSIEIAGRVFRFVEDY